MMILQGHCAGQAILEDVSGCNIARTCSSMHWRFTVLRVISCIGASLLYMSHHIMPYYCTHHIMPYHGTWGRGVSTVLAVRPLRVSYSSNAWMAIPSLRQLSIVTVCVYLKSKSVATWAEVLSCLFVSDCNSLVALAFAFTVTSFGGGVPPRSELQPTGGCANLCWRWRPASD